MEVSMKRILFLILTLIISLVSQMGDIFFSKIKRENGIKDFSNFVSDNDKSSINEQNIIDYNGIEIESVKKRKWFTYNVKDALNKFLQKG